ncbi:ATP-binding cassette sub-family A member 17-like [Amblyomma americanum]
MDVCEANCSRVGILVSGLLQCLGTVPQLLARFGRGFTLQVKCVAKESRIAAALEGTVATLFPGIVLTDVHPGLFRFTMSEMLQWSVLFARVNQLHRQFQLEYVNVSSTALEEVFIDFIRKARAPAESLSPADLTAKVGSPAQRPTDQAAKVVSPAQRPVMSTLARQATKSVTTAPALARKA